MTLGGTSLVVQWLRLQEVWVQSLVGELRSHMPRSQEKKKMTLGIDCVLPKPSNQDSQPVYRIHIQAYV